MTSISRHSDETAQWHGDGRPDSGPVSPTAQIIFLTVSKEHVFEALDVMPLHYLLKQDVGTGKIETVLLRAVSLAEKSQRQSFTYKFGKTIGSVLLRDIVYFEVKTELLKFI